MSISMNPELGDQVREAATRAGLPLSAWLADAASAKLRSEALDAFLDADDINILLDASGVPPRVVPV